MCPLWFLPNRNVLWTIFQAKPLVFRCGFFRQLDSKLVTFAIDGGRNKPKFISKMQVTSELRKLFDAPLMRCYPVSTRINHVANDDAECSRRVELAELQDHLFM